jgi:hypothetical protein
MDITVQISVVEQSASFTVKNARPSVVEDRTAILYGKIWNEDQKHKNVAKSFLLFHRKMHFAFF